MRARHIGSFLVIVIGLALAGSAAGQTGSSSPSAPPNAPDKAKAGTPNEQKERANQKSGAPAAPSDPNAAGTNKAERPPDDLSDEEIDKLPPAKREAAIYRKIAHEEEKLIRRRAKIGELRAQAQAQGNQERLDALAKLEQKTEEVHRAKLEKWRARIGDENVERMRERMHGKAKSKSKTKGKEGAATNEQKAKEKEKAAKNPNAPGPGPGPGSGPGNAKPADKEGDKNKEKAKEKAKGSKGGEGEPDDDDPGVGTRSPGKGGANDKPPKGANDKPGGKPGAGGGGGS
jgi:hypothetical protein